MPELLTKRICDVHGSNVFTILLYSKFLATMQRAMYVQDGEFIIVMRSFELNAYS